MIERDSLTSAADSDLPIEHFLTTIRFSFDDLKIQNVKLDNGRCINQFLSVRVCG